MSVSALNTITPASLLIPVSGSGSTTNTSSTSPVVGSSDPGLAAQVSALSTDSGVIATLGSSTDSQVYDAAGLYNSIAQAGTSTTTAATSGTGSSTSTDTGTSGSTTTGNTTSAAAAAASAAQSLNSSILSTLPGGSYSGFYDGTGVVQSTSSASGTNLTSNWASALQTNPNLAHTVAADSFAQGIVGTLSTTA